ncbi:phage tail tape measure protein [Paenibacillus sp. 1P03SA]|uniref:phage tail tape measure protein n=1 Tax=Paenibacillus sp. 1P03SA TaxID=3132294 RepID=UPI00399F373B
MAYDLVARLRLIDNMTGPLDKATGGLKGVGKMALGVSTAIAGIGAAIGAVSALTSSVDKAMSFEGQMDSIASLDESMKKGTAGYARMQALALEMGAKTKYSALEAAKGMEELVKAGLSVEQIDKGGGLEAALNLATAGGLDLAEAAEVMSTSLNAFKDNNLKAADAANILAGTANASATDVRDLKYSLAQVSAVANGVGMTFRDTNIALGLFANNGIKGSDAGTSLKTMLSNLQPGTKTQTLLMQKLGIMTADGANKFFDAAGNLKDLESIAGTLQDSMKNLTNQQRAAALETLFGSDAVRAGNILYKEGAKGVAEFSTKLKEAPTALQVATAKMDNAQGAVEQFKGAMETLQISALLPTMPLIKNLALAAANFAGKLTTWLSGDQAKAWGAAISGTINTVKGVFTGMFQLFSGDKMGGINTLFGAGMDAGQIKTVIRIVNTIKSALAGVMDFINKLSPIFKAQMESWGKFFSDFWTLIQPLFPPIGAAIKAVGDVILKLAPLLLPVKDAVLGFIMTVVGAFMTQWPTIVSIMQTVWTNLQPVFGFIGSAIGVVIDVVKMVGNVFAYIWPSLVEIVQKVAPPLSKMIGNISEMITWLVDNVVKPLIPVMGEIFKGVWDYVLKPVLDGITAGITAVIDTINWLAEAWKTMQGVAGKIASFFGLTGGDNDLKVVASSGPALKGPLPHAPGQASSHASGLSNVPYNGYLARLHKDERVLTPEENASYRKGGGSYSFGNIVINGASGDVRQMADELMAEIARRVSEAGGQM